MKKLCLLLTLATLPWAALAQENNQTGSDINSVSTNGNFVTITAKGLDVRSVLYDLFQQTGHNFVIDQGVRYVLYLNLSKVEFGDALVVVLKQAELGYEVKNGIYYIGNNRPKNFSAPVKPKTEVKTETKPTGKPVDSGSHAPVGSSSKGDHGSSTSEQKDPASAGTAAVGKLTTKDLQKRLTTRLSMADLRSVFNEFAKQTGFTIEVDPNVPQYKLDAFLIDTSLKYAMDVVCDAAKLKYTLTEKGTIRVENEASH